MSKRLSLNGDDWKVTGWWKNQWRFGRSMELGAVLDATIPTMPAKVPGAVQMDLMRSGFLPDPNYGLDSNLGEWVNNREWFYDKEFFIPRDFNGEKYILCFDGLDYSGEIHLNGKKIKEFAGMFIPVEIDITAELNRTGKNYLRIIFYQTPEVDGQIGYSNRIQILKSRFNYVWDWCPRIVPVGIWRDVYIKVYSYARVKDFYPNTKVDFRNGKGEIDINLDVDASISGRYEFIYRVWKDHDEICIIKEDKTLIAARQSIVSQIILEDVGLWWPSGWGGQPLYNIEVVIKKDGVVCDRTEKRIGFSDFKFVQNPNSPTESLPYTLIVNGKRIFLKGVNWVPISPFYGGVTREEYKNYIQRFKDMNCNILRVWGGAILENKDFYDTCDEMGMMVWQEFPQSSSGINNTPPDNPEFLKELKEVGIQFIVSRRHHISQVVWSGGNELMWSNSRPVDEGHENIKMLKELVEKLDPDKHFLPTSASGPKQYAAPEDFGKGLHHDVHGPWLYGGEPSHYTYCNDDDSLLRSETGSPGIARIETLEKYKGQFNIWPPDETNPYWIHRGAWWIQKDELTRLFGEWNDEKELKQYIQSSRFLQAESLRYSIEAMRRREPEASGFIIWMGNEPFPNNSNTSVIEYDGTPKPSYYWVRNAFSPIHASLKYNKIRYAAGEIFGAEVYLHDDNKVGENLRVISQIIDTKGRILEEQDWNIQSEHSVMKIAPIQWKIVDCPGNLFFVRLKVLSGDCVVDENVYIFTVDCSYPFEPLRNMPSCNIKISKTSDKTGEWKVINTSSVPALGIFIYGKEPGDFLQAIPNYFTLMPKEEKIVRMSTIHGVIHSQKDFSINVLNGMH